MTDSVKPEYPANSFYEIHAQFKNEVMQELAAGRLRMDEIEKRLSENTKLTCDMKAETGELLDIFRSLKGGFRVIGWLGTAAKWVAGIIGACVAIWGFIQAITHGGKL